MEKRCAGVMKRYLTAAIAVVFAVALGAALAQAPGEAPVPGPAAQSRTEEENTREAGLPAEESKPEQESSSVAAQPPERSYEDAPPPSSEQPPAGYYIRDWNGRVSIIRDGEETPEMIFDIYTRLLPEYDQQQLKEGLYVESYEELTAMIEDYIS